jgi:RNA polymerase sigma factor (sigma-70 family)
MNYHRDRKITVPVDVEKLVVDERGDLERSEMIEIMMRAMSLLDEKYREAFALREISGLKYAEIAEITGTTLSGSKTRVARAAKQMIKILSPYMKDFQR